MSLRNALFASSLAAIGLTAACGPPPVQLRSAIATCEEGRIEDCKRRCDQGQGEACYKLGWFYEVGQRDGRGRRLAADFDRAMALYQRACDIGSATACRALGDLYWNGHRRSRNRPKAIEYWDRACALGLDLACPTALERDIAARRRAQGETNADGTVSIGTDSRAPALNDTTP